MTTLEKLFILKEAAAEIERLETQNTLLKSALIRVTELYASGNTDQSDIMARAAQEALKQCK